MPKCMRCGKEADKNHVCDACENAGKKLSEEKELTGFQKWYEKNKEIVSEKRKQKYDENKEYREQQRLAAKRYYWLKKRRATSVGLNQVEYEELELKPDREIEIVVTHKDDIRNGMKLSIPVFYPKQAAKVLRRTTQTLRLWFLNGKLPEATYRDARRYRLFTEDQMRIFAENRYLLSFTVRDFDKHPFFVKTTDEMLKLEPDGIRPMLKDRWRLDPSVCPWCGHAPSLQKKNDDGVWEHVQCFECKSATEVYEREKLNRYIATGSCRCGAVIDEDVESVDENVIVICPDCGMRVPDIRLEKV